METFGFSDVQAQEIVNMRLYQLTGMERERLEKEFFISKYHISREFKRQTGITVHQYIVKAKLDLCKRLLEKGYPMTEIYKICGLGNYNNLFRAFKREFGITPGEYVRQFQERQKTKSDVH